MGLRRQECRRGRHACLRFEPGTGSTSSVFFHRPVRQILFDLDASAPHAQVDPPLRSLTCIIEVRTHQELAKTVQTFARKIGRNAAHSSSGVDRVWTRIRQHHDHVSGVAAHIEVSSHIAYPYVAVVVVDYQPRVPRHMDPVLNRDAAPSLRQKAIASGQDRRNRQLFIGAPFGDHADLLEGLFRALMLAGFMEAIGRLDDGDLNLWFIPAFHRQVAVRVVETNGSARCEGHPLRIGYFKRLLGSYLVDSLRGRQRMYCSEHAQPENHHQSFCHSGHPPSFCARAVFMNGGPVQDEIAGGSLIYAASGNQRHLWTKPAPVFHVAIGSVGVMAPGKTTISFFSANSTTWCGFHYQGKSLVPTAWRSCSRAVK